ncbi:type I restriction modification DNA specificity domain protein [Prevotella sp. CAG:924]|nr:type I restriction modification DNA specificity domain protein [Prevotella sp. CAG:924]
MMENRYDKYKDSGVEWIGEIPEHWEIRKLKNIFLLSTGTTPKEFDKISEEDNLINWYTPADILDGCNDLFNSQRKLSEKVICENNISLFPIGTLLYVGIGASAGKIGYANENGYSNQQITGLIPLECYSRFYFYYLSVLKDKIRDNAFFTTLPIINNVYLGQELIPYPLSSEQQSIATYLDQKCGEIDELITLQEEMITKLQSYKQSVITEAVTKGLDKNVPLKDSGVEWIGEIPEHWGSRRIKTFSLVKRGASPRPIDDPKYFDENGEFAWVRIADVSASGKYLECTTQKLSKLGSSLSVKRYPGDIFISIAGTVGKPIITNIKCCIHDGFVYFPNMKGISVEYLYYVFLSGQPYLGLGKMGTQLNLNTETIGNIYIPYPNIVEQTKIVYFLCQKCGEIDELISIKQQKIEKLKEYKKSLIFECVTGKRKVC